MAQNAMISSDREQVTGLTDDDHTIYIQANGTCTSSVASKPVWGVKQ